MHSVKKKEFLKSILSNGKIKNEGHWFDGQRNGVFRTWDDKGDIVSAKRYKEGNLIEDLLN